MMDPNDLSATTQANDEAVEASPAPDYNKSVVDESEPASADQPVE